MTLSMWVQCGRHAVGQCQGWADKSGSRGLGVWEGGGEGGSDIGLRVDVKIPSH